MDVNSILLDILIVLVAAKVAAELADRIGIPAVVGEIVAGVLVGPSVFGLVDTNEVLHTLAELGVILLLLDVGMEMDLRELRSVGRASLLVALVGVALPMATGAAAALGLGMTGKEAIFVGAALTATSVGITARVFGDLRALATVEARTVLGAAVADDILGLVILTVVVRAVTEGSVSAMSLLSVTGIALGFVVVATAVSLRIAPPLFGMIRRHSRSTGTLVALALGFTLALAELAHLADLAPIIGAFVAGLALARTSSAERVRRELAPVGHLLIPVFFLQIGIDADVEAFADPKVLGVAAALLAVAILGKLVAAIGVFGSPGDKLLVGIGMVPRGEVGLIFATLGLREGIFDQDLYGAMLLVVLATTVLTPPALKWRLLALRARRRAEPSATVGAGTGGLVALDDKGRVSIAGEPPPSDALAVALSAARLCADHPPSDALLEWLADFPPGPRRWDEQARAELWRLLSEGGSRSWRLLTASTVLQRCLPELDDALAHRRSGGLEIDPLSALHFPRLVAVRDALPGASGAAQPEALLLAALVLDACDGVPTEPNVVARRTASRLDIGTRLEQAVAGLVSDAALLAAVARRVDALAEEPVLQLAMHLGSSEQLRALHLLTMAMFSGEQWERERIGALVDLVQEVLAHGDMVGAAGAVEQRKAKACALTTDPEVQERIMSAPREYAVGQSPEDLARHATLCEPTPRRNEVRVAVTGSRVEIVTRDQVGLLARAARALSDMGNEIKSALAVTWGDGTALSSYEISEPFPEAHGVESLLRDLFQRKLEAPAIHGVVLEFDDQGSPWHTRCSIQAADQRGLLQAVATAFAAAGVNVHSAYVSTEGGAAIDAFDLTGRDGGKLDDATKRKVRDLLAAGVGRRRFRPATRRRSSGTRSPVRSE